MAHITHKIRYSDQKKRIYIYLVPSCMPESVSCNFCPPRPRQILPQGPFAGAGHRMNNQTLATFRVRFCQEFFKRAPAFLIQFFLCVFLRVCAPFFLIKNRAAPGHNRPHPQKDHGVWHKECQEAKQELDKKQTQQKGGHGSLVSRLAQGKSRRKPPCTIHGAQQACQ